MPFERGSGGCYLCSGATVMCSSCVVNDHFDSFNKVPYAYYLWIIKRPNWELSSDRKISGVQFRIDECVFTSSHDLLSQCVHRRAKAPWPFRYVQKATSTHRYIVLFIAVFSWTPWGTQRKHSLKKQEVKHRGGISLYSRTYFIAYIQSL